MKMNDLHRVNIGSGFSSCCGSKYAGENPDEQTFKKGYRGIKLAIGKHFEEGDYNDGTQRIQHIKTKNGYLTTSIRHKWSKASV
jgi:hypothetical protein